MTKIIPNQHTWVGFSTAIANIATPTTTEIAAATNITPLLIAVNASSTGNTVPTPTLDTLFDASIGGTSTATFTMDLYRDDVPANDIAWPLFPRGAKGFIIISRFGGTGTGRRPATTQVCEVWPIQVTSRSMSQMASNTAEIFTVSAAVPSEPNEAAVVA